MIKLVAMDLDGTLTQHKSKPDEECLRVLVELSAKYSLLIVGAGGCERIFQQLGAFEYGIIGYYGMQTAVSDGKTLSVTQSAIVAIDKPSVTRRIDTLRLEFGYTDYAGNTVEFHDSGMITFPLIGTEASINDKLAFDPDRIKRRAIYSKVKEVFSDFTVFVGGSSSFDIVPKPYCKSYALDEYMQQCKISSEQAIYYGDDYGVGGNDEDVYKSGIKFFGIDDYKDFPEIARNALL